MRDKKELIQEFIAVSEKPDFDESNKLPQLEVLIDIRDQLKEVADNLDSLCRVFFNKFH